MINKIQLQFGAKGKSEKLEIEPGSVTIFVGPNNSGKSTILREIEKYCQNGEKANFEILDDTEFMLPSDNDLMKKIELMQIPFPKNDNPQIGEIKFGRFHSTRGFIQHSRDPKELAKWKNNPDSLPVFIRHFVTMYVSRFGGKERFLLIKGQENGDLKSHPTTSLFGLFQNDIKRKEVRSLLFEAFQKYFVIDPTNMKTLEVRLSNTPPSSDEVEKGWTDASVSFHKSAKHTTEFSDGVQAFTGLVMTVIAGEET